jgi:hypothetical protein
LADKPAAELAAAPAVAVASPKRTRDSSSLVRIGSPKAKAKPARKSKQELADDKFINIKLKEGGARVKSLVASYMRDQIFVKQLAAADKTATGLKEFGGVAKYNKEGGVTYYRMGISQADKALKIEILQTKVKGKHAQEQLCHIYCYMFVLKPGGWLPQKDQNKSLARLLERFGKMGNPFFIRDLQTNWQDVGHYRINWQDDGSWVVTVHGDADPHFIAFPGTSEGGVTLTYMLDQNWVATEAVVICCETKVRTPIRAKFWEKYQDTVDTFIDKEPISLEPDGKSPPPDLKDRLALKEQTITVENEGLDFSAISAAHATSAAPAKKQRLNAPPGDGKTSEEKS